MRWVLCIIGLLLCTLAQGQPAAETTVNILDTATLNDLEQSGFSLSELLGGNRQVHTSDIYGTNTHTMIWLTPWVDTCSTTAKRTNSPNLSLRARATSLTWCG